jgi:hypothetical protein
MMGSVSAGSTGSRPGVLASVTRIANTTGNRLGLLAGTERTSHVYCICRFCSTHIEMRGWLFSSRSCETITLFCPLTTAGVCDNWIT